MEYKDPALIRTLKDGLVAVMPTDTIYGIVGRADKPETVNRIYEARKRAPDKPCIILIGKQADLAGFGIAPTQKQAEEIAKYWPGPVSIIFDCHDNALEYLHRGTRTLAFRLPSLPDLCALLAETGPLIAPSANPEGLPPAKNITEARAYFGSAIDFYHDGGDAAGRASKVIKLLADGSVTIIRE